MLVLAAAFVTAQFVGITLVAPLSPQQPIPTSAATPTFSPTSSANPTPLPTGGVVQPTITATPSSPPTSRFQAVIAVHNTGGIQNQAYSFVVFFDFAHRIAFVDMPHVTVTPQLTADVTGLANYVINESGQLTPLLTQHTCSKHFLATDAVTTVQIQNSTAMSENLKCFDQFPVTELAGEIQTVAKDLGFAPRAPVGKLQPLR